MNDANHQAATKRKHDEAYPNRFVRCGLIGWIHLQRHVWCFCCYSVLKEGPIYVDVLNDDDVVDERMVWLVSFPPQ